MNRTTLAKVLAAIVAVLGVLIPLLEQDPTPPTAPGRHAAPAPKSSESDLAGSRLIASPAESELRDETPPGISHAELAAGQLVTGTLGTLAGVRATPLPAGGAQNYSVTQDFSGHVYSDFGSTIPPLFVLHCTVSPNTPGWGDVRGVQDYFKRTRIGSSTYIADFEAHILQMVPLSMKSWTQGAVNPYVRASVEIIARCTETRAQWLASQLFKEKILAQLMVDVMRRYHLPIRMVDPDGCIFPGGYTDHLRLECGNDHTDVGTGFPWDVFNRQVAEIAKYGSPCSQTCRNMRHRHRQVHKDLHRVCRRDVGRRRHPKVCRKLANRNSYMHGYAHRHKFTLTR